MDIIVSHGLQGIVLRVQLELRRASEVVKTRLILVIGLSTPRFHAALRNPVFEAVTFRQKAFRSDTACPLP